MCTAFQQQVFALDAKYNAYRATQTPNFRTLYIRRRSQLLRDTEHSLDDWRQYLKLRTSLLQAKYGNTHSLSRTISKTSVFTLNTNTVVLPSGPVIPTKEAEASRAIVGGGTIAENYAFVGVHHIFDQHSGGVAMVKFANNDRSRLCCSSSDGNLSICEVVADPPKHILLKGHSHAVPCFDWSSNNDLIVSASLDGTIRVWETKKYHCLRTLNEPNGAPVRSCIFKPNNNNVVIVGTSRGELRIANVSTGLFAKSICRIGGTILSLTSDTTGKVIWTGNDKGEIVSVFCQLDNSGLCKMKKFNLEVPCLVTGLSYRAWISREAADPLLLVNASNNSLNLFSVKDCEGSLELKQRFPNRHQSQLIKSTFCPIMSFRQGACVVTGSEDGSIYFLDIERSGSKAIVNTLQGHATCVLSISFNYDESLLATSDQQGLVIIWKRASK